jgi:hypothetical protein
VKFRKSLPPQLIKRARADVGLDLLVPKLGLIFAKPPPNFKDFHWWELLDLIDDFCRTHASTITSRPGLVNRKEAQMARKKGIENRGTRGTRGRGEDEKGIATKRHEEPQKLSGEAEKRRRD